MTAPAPWDPDAADKELMDRTADFYAEPLAWVLWAFDWGHGDLAGETGPDEWQCEWLTSYGKAIRERAFDGINPVDPIREATASGHGIGKSALTSWIILFIMSTRAHCKGVVTANTADQLKTKTWGELAKWKRLCITGHWFDLNSGKGSLSISKPEFPETWRVDAMTCREENSEAFAGLHAAQSTPFYLFDEASNVPDKIFEVAEGGLTDGEPLFAVFGNPTRNTGKFRQLFTQSSRWTFRHIDARTCKKPNKQLHDQWLKDWGGENSDFFRVRVRGLFPNADDTQFMSTSEVEEAMTRPLGRYLGNDPLVMGVDVARGGSDNCMVHLRRGYDGRSEKTFRIPGEVSRDSMRFVSILVDIISKTMPDMIFVDETGIGGPIVDRLVQLGYPAKGVKFGGKADNERMFANKTAEMGYRCREWIRNGGCLPHNPTLALELTTRGFSHTSKDQLLLDSKDWIKEHLGYSPDWGDALYLTFAEHVPPLAMDRGVKDLSYEARYNMVNRHRGDYDPLARE